MGELKDRIIRLIEQNAAKKVSDLAGEYVRAKSGQKCTPDVPPTMLKHTPE